MKNMTDYKGIKGLENIMARLRDEGGCPWDREQDYHSLKKYIIEEAYELTEAIESADMTHIKEECGDLLLQVVFIAQIAREDGVFELDGVIDNLIAKLIRRHPHVFSDMDVKDADEVTVNWERIKSSERAEKAAKDASEAAVSAIDGVPRAMPALMRAYRIQEKAAKVGFDWQKGDQEPVFAKIEEELEELKEALASGDAENIAMETGDLLCSVVNLSRRIGVDPEGALHGTCEKFSARFRAIESMLISEGKDIRKCTLEELDGYWELAKMAKFNVD